MESCYRWDLQKTTLYPKPNLPKEKRKYIQEWLHHVKIYRNDKTRLPHAKITKDKVARPSSDVYWHQSSFDSNPFPLSPFFRHKSSLDFLQRAGGSLGQQSAIASVCWLSVVLASQHSGPSQSVHVWGLGSVILYPGLSWVIALQFHTVTTQGPGLLSLHNQMNQFLIINKHLRTYLQTYTHMCARPISVFLENSNTGTFAGVKFYRKFLNK